MDRHDTILHLGRAHHVVGPDDAHDGNINLWKNVRRHAHERTAGKQGDGRGAVVGAMCGQPRLVELYKMAASASGKYPFAFTIARIARQLQSATDARRRKTLRDAFENDEKTAEILSRRNSLQSSQAI